MNFILHGSVVVCNGPYLNNLVEGATRTLQGESQSWVPCVFIKHICSLRDFKWHPVNWHSSSKHYSSERRTQLLAIVVDSAGRQRLVIEGTVEWRIAGDSFTCACCLFIVIKWQRSLLLDTIIAMPPGLGTSLTYGGFRHHEWRLVISRVAYRMLQRPSMAETNIRHSIHSSQPILRPCTQAAVWCVAPGYQAAINGCPVCRSCVLLCPDRLLPLKYQSK